MTHKFFPYAYCVMLCFIEPRIPIESSMVVIVDFCIGVTIYEGRQLSKHIAGIP